VLVVLKGYFAAKGPADLNAGPIENAVETKRDIVVLVEDILDVQVRPKWHEIEG
jgi:hypothetical protein